MLELQRAVGNRATAAALAAQAADVPPKAPAGNADGSPAVKERRIGASKIVNAATMVAPVLGRLSAGAAAALHPVLALQRAAGGGVTVAPPKAGTAPKRLGAQTDVTEAEKMKVSLTDYKAAREEAGKIIDNATKAEPNITNGLRAVAAANFGSLEGLENRLKTDASLTEKLVGLVKTRVEAGEDAKKALAAEVPNIKDALRYTVVVQGDRYKDVAENKVPVALNGVGATQIKNKNYWTGPDKSDSYKGINQAYTVELKDRIPFPFEVQLHTTDSFATKTKAHGLYEEARKPGTSPEERKKIEAEMAKGWENVPVPKGMT